MNWPKLSDLAAAWGYAFARNHPFVDGNKRTALLAIYTFLGVNEAGFIVPEADAAAMILALAAGEVNEQNLARWIRDNWPKTMTCVPFRSIVATSKCNDVCVCWRGRIA